MIQLFRWFCVVFAMVHGVVSFAAEDIRLLPEDEAGRDLSLLAFREQLKTVIEKKDAQALVDMLDKNVSISARSRGSKKKFLKFWLPEVKNSELWPTLAAIVDMGGGFVRSERGVKFCAPYVFTNFPAELDIYAHGVVTQDNVPLKAGPSVTAPVKDHLSYHIVAVEDWRSTPDLNTPDVRWLKVKTLGGKEGYVDYRLIRSPSDYSLCFLQRPKTGWKIISLIGNE